MCQEEKNADISISFISGLSREKCSHDYVIYKLINDQESGAERVMPVKLRRKIL